jgi:hypothetical protein
MLSTLFSFQVSHILDIVSSGVLGWTRTSTATFGRLYAVLLRHENKWYPCADLNGELTVRSRVRYPVSPQGHNMVADMGVEPILPD